MMPSLQDIEKLTTHELCLLVSRVSMALASRIAPPTELPAIAYPPGVRLANRHGTPGDTPDKAMADAICESGLEGRVAKIKAARKKSAAKVPAPQRLECKVCGVVWYREPRAGRPPTRCQLHGSPS